MPLSEQEELELLQLEKEKATATTVPQNRGLLGSALERIDAYSGAPVRAAIGSLQNTGVEGRGLLDAGKAFYNQIGASAETAPTGKEIVRKMGVPDTALSDVVPALYAERGSDSYFPQKGGMLDPTASGTAGLVADVALDPTTYLPIGAAAKTAGLLAKESTLGAKAINAASKVIPTEQQAVKGLTRLAKTGLLPLLGLGHGIEGLAVGMALSNPKAIKSAVKAGKMTAEQGEKLIKALASQELAPAVKGTVQMGRAQELENRKGLLAQ